MKTFKDRLRRYLWAKAPALASIVLDCLTMRFVFRFLFGFILFYFVVMHSDMRFLTTHLWFLAFVSIVGAVISFMWALDD